MMDLQQLFKDLALHIIVFLALILLYGIIRSTLKLKSNFIRGIFTGIVFSAIAGFGMLFPIEILPGAVVDGRIIIVGIAGAYGGLPAGVTTAILVTLIRLSMGGVGVAVGCAGIIGGCLVGLAFYFTKRRGQDIFKPKTLVLMGIVLTAQGQLLAPIFLPWEIVWTILRRVSIPGFILYPLGTLLIGSLLNYYHRYEAMVLQIKANEERFRSVLETISDGIILQSSSGEILTWNKGAEDIFGISAKDALGQTMESKDWPTIRAEETKYEGKDHPFMQTLRTGKPCRNKIMGVYQPSENLRWISINTNPLFAENNDKPYATAISFSDITQLKKEKDRSQKYLDIAGVMLLTLDERGKITLVNKKACEILESSEGELLGINWFENLLPDENIENTKKIFNELMNGNTETFEYVENKIISKSGNEKIIAWHHTVIKNENGEISGTLSSGEDITERVKAEDDLRKGETKYRKLFEGSLDAIFILDKKSGRYLDANQAGEKLTGRSLSELKKLTTKDVTPQGAKQRLKYIAPINESTNFGEVIYLQPDGTKRVAELISVPLDDKTIYGIAKDVTERKKMEKSIQESQKMESIGNLAGGIAHDFNNILFPIMGLSDLLLEDLPEGSPERENAGEIYSAGKRGSDLVEQILVFSSQSEHKMMPTRIQNVLKEVTKLFRSTIPADIEINQDLQQDCGMVIADPSQIHQVAMNIMTNAYHAVETEGGKIFVKLEETVLEASDLADTNLDPGRYAVLSISDTGHGISTDLMTKIFDPYFTTKEHGKGTGLGLAVVYGIIKDHKGKIKIESKIGKGSTFNVYLPLMGKVALAESFDPEKEYRGGTERILLVDDEEPIVKLETKILERLGYKVTSRLHSIEALEAFKAGPDSFDLVVTDMSMPNMTGTQLAEVVFSIRPEIPVIICTGFSERIDKKKSEKLGIKGFLMKPVVRSEMAETVRNVLDEAKS